MTLLILGVLLWAFAHLFKRLAPELRASLGEPGKGLVALALLGAIALMVFGYQSADSTVFWGRHPATAGINNLLMLLAVYLMVASGMPVRLKAMMRHPQLTAVKTWALAHLLVNGDTASFILFGGLLAWAVASVILINRAGKPPLPTVATSVAAEAGAVAVTLALYGVIAWLHTLTGYPVFG